MFVSTSLRFPILVNGAGVVLSFSSCNSVWGGRVRSKESSAKVILEFDSLESKCFDLHPEDKQSAKISLLLVSATK